MQKQRAQDASNGKKFPRAIIPHPAFPGELSFKSPTVEESDLHYGESRDTMMTRDQGDSAWQFATPEGLGSKPFVQKFAQQSAAAAILSAAWRTS